MVNLQRVLFAGFGVSLVVAAAFWLSDTGTRRGLLPKLETNQPIYYMKSFTLTAFGVDGSVHHQLSADELSYFADDTAKLDRPQLLLTLAENRWNVEAKSGVVSPAEQIHLFDGVRVSQQSNDNQPGLAIVTDELNVDLPAGMAETATPVKLEHLRGEIRANEMQLWFNQKQLFLHNRVRGSYHAP